jgi:hypothetical protein
LSADYTMKIFYKLPRWPGREETAGPAEFRRIAGFRPTF